MCAAAVGFKRNPSARQLGLSQTLEGWAYQESVTHVESQNGRGRVETFKGACAVIGLATTPPPRPASAQRGLPVLHAASLCGHAAFHLFLDRAAPYLCLENDAPLTCSGAAPGPGWLRILAHPHPS